MHKATAEVPLYGDGNWVDAWPDRSNPPPPDYSGTHSDNGMRRFFVDRHSKAINLGYADGHVAKARLKDLWIQTWHQDYKPRLDVTMPPNRP